MRKVINTAASIVFLAVLFVLPLGAFGFEGYKDEASQLAESSSLAVLGTMDVKSKEQKGSKEVVDEINLKLNLGKSLSEKFYNVVPEKYLGENYNVLVFIPDDLARKGIEAKLIMNQLSADLEVVLLDDSLAYSEINLSLIILK